MPWSRVLPAVLLLILVPLPFVAGNHSQTENGRTVSFDHKTGNEWWVEVTMAGPDAATITKVEAMDTNGPWTTLSKRSTTVYGSSFHIEPGHQVRFRATWSDGDVVTSCWFTHPAGLEQCSTPPSPWRTTQIGSAGLYASYGDMALSDVDNDGRRDVTLATDRGLRVYEWSGSAWTTELITSIPLGGVAAGDGDGDGDNEIYAVQPGSSGSTLHRYEKTANGWTTTPMFTFDETHVGDMTLGNIDGIAGPELYIGLYEGWCDPSAPGFCIANGTVYHVRKGSVAWAATLIAEPSGHIDSLWIGDADSAAGSELYVGHGTRHADRTTLIRNYQGDWVHTELPGSGSDSGMALAVVGDPDRNGKNDVYVANWYGQLRKLTHDHATGWSDTVIVADTGYNPHSLFAGDADSDGTQELYMGVAGGALVQVRWSGTAWVVTKISDPTATGMEGSNTFLVVGDGDGDGRREAYLAVGFLPPDYSTWDTGATRVYKVEIPGPSGFDATFTGVKGNQWWEQVSVAATGGTIAGVDLRLNGGAWQPMTKQSYGWTASVRAVDGTIVQFRATSTGGATDLSDCYRWIPPSGAEATRVSCGGGTTTTTTSTTSTTGSAFDATFSGAKGNEWWVQVSVTGNQPIQEVAFRTNCSEEWRSLTKQSYGWAASYHVPSGSKVDFRAISTSGNMDFSGGYIWPQATPTSAC